MTLTFQSAEKNKRFRKIKQTFVTKKIHDNSKMKTCLSRSKVL